MSLLYQNYFLINVTPAHGALVDVFSKFVIVVVSVDSNVGSTYLDIEIAPPYPNVPDVVKVLL